MGWSNWLVGLPWWVSVKNLPACQWRRHGFDLWVRKIPWSREWLHIPVFSPRKSHGQSSLAGYSPRGSKESSKTEHSFCMKIKESLSRAHLFATPWTGGCLPGFSVQEISQARMLVSAHGILQARILEWVAIAFSRGIFPIQGSNPGLLHCRQILYRLTHQGSLSACSSKGNAWYLLFL